MFILPSGNRPPQTIKENLLPYFSDDLLRKSLRVAQYNIGGEKDECFVQLDASSLDQTSERVRAAINEIKGTENRPCIFFVGMDTVRISAGQELLDPLGIGMTEFVRRNGDPAIYTIKFGSTLLRI